MSGRIHISSRTPFIVNMVFPRQHTSHWKAVSWNKLLDIVHAFWSQTLELHTTTHGLHRDLDLRTSINFPGKPHFTLTLLQKRTYQVHGSQLRVVQVTGIGEYCQEAACRWLPTAHWTKNPDTEGNKLQDIQRNIDSQQNPSRLGYNASVVNFRI